MDKYTLLLVAFILAACSTGIENEGVLEDNEVILRGVIGGVNQPGSPPYNKYTLTIYDYEIINESNIFFDPVLSQRDDKDITIWLRRENIEVVRERIYTQQTFSILKDTVWIFNRFEQPNLCYQ